MNRYFKQAVSHFLTITKHKHLVMLGCFRVGLFRQGLLHDLSKYSPTEFLVGCRYYQGNRSPNNAEREEKGYTTAWLHHKGRNRHHYEYWLDYHRMADGTVAYVGSKMPIPYVVEMFMDRVAACKIYQGKAYTPESPLRYYKNGKARELMHPDTARLLELLLTRLATKGEKATFSYIRRRVLQKGYVYKATP